MSRPRALKNDPEAQEAAKAFANLDAKKARDANDAIAILERRAHTATKEIELPGGDKIRIRSRLSRTEFAEAVRLEGEISTRYAAGDNDGVIAASNALIGHLLYMEDMAPDEVGAWLNEHPDAVSDIDAEEIVLAFRRMRREELARLKQIADFREE